MFVRKKKNRSGSITIEVLRKDRALRSNVVVSVIGTAKDPDEVEALCRKAHKLIAERRGQDLFDGAEREEEAARYDQIFSGLRQDQLRLVGPELVYGALYDRIGYDKIKTHNPDLFRALVITRLYKPGSKLRTIQYMSRFMHHSYTPDQVYYFLDKLCARGSAEGSECSPDDSGGKSDTVTHDVKWQVEQITFEHTKKSVGGTVSVVFYDTTTLYFESREDDMRIPGFSKDGKHSNPQVVLGLLVASGGNPIGYELHKGNQYEGTTMIPIIKKLQKRFNLEKPVVIADAGLLNKTNIRQLEEDDYEYILGARVKSMKQADKDLIVGLGLKNGEAASVVVDGKRVVVSMSDKRAAKDASERAKGVERLRKRFRTGKLTKSSVNNRGYNCFLSVDGEAKVKIDEAKIEESKKLDGLKGYITNSSLTDDEIISNYRYLFMIERVFRFNKTDLDIRPMYHRLFNRIEGHVCICFTAYTILLELERLLKENSSDITLYRAKFITETIYEIKYDNPYNNKSMSVLLQTDCDEEVSELLRIVRGSMDG